MKSIFVGATLAMLMASQAQALSCMRPDVARAFDWASQAEESYVVLLGRLDFEAPATRRGRPNDPQDLHVAARFTGQSLGVSGFSATAPLDVSLAFTCAGPWCGSMTPSRGDVLAFVERSADGYVLNVGPCGGTTFERPTHAQIQQVESCMRGQACTAAAMR